MTEAHFLPRPPPGPSTRSPGWFMGFLLDGRPLNSELAVTYTALNARIQGSAADIMKDAMVIWESGVCDVIGAPHLMHDELDLSSARHPAGARGGRRDQAHHGTCRGTQPSAQGRRQVGTQLGACG